MFYGLWRKGGGRRGPCKGWFRRTSWLVPASVAGSIKAREGPEMGVFGKEVDTHVPLPDLDALFVHP